jgi:hypothetical protein
MHPSSDLFFVELILYAVFGSYAIWQHRRLVREVTGQAPRGSSSGRVETGPDEGSGSS